MAMFFRLCGGFGILLSLYSVIAVRNGAVLLLCTLPPTGLFFFCATAIESGAKERQQKDQLFDLQQQQADYLRQMASTSSAELPTFPKVIEQSPVMPNVEHIKAQMQAAKVLIETKNYHAARALLLTINHERARDWLAKLDAIMK